MEVNVCSSMCFDKTIAMTFNNVDFSNRFREVRKRGFIQITENPTTQWIFTKDDTLVVGEKRIISVSTKKITRYEVSVGNLTNFKLEQ